MFFKIGIPEGLQLDQKETPKLVFSCECLEIFKITFFYRTPLVASSEINLKRS